MKKIKRILLTLSLIGITALVAFHFGKENQVVEYVNQEENGVFECPFVMSGGFYNDYVPFSNEIKMGLKPEIIESPEVEYNNEPFNLAKFEKELKDTGLNRGYSDRNFDVDNDGEDEQILLHSVADNHGYHVATIVKDGIIIFTKGGANVWVESSPDGNGFTFSKDLDWVTGKYESIRYIPENGGFVPVWMQKSCGVKFK